VLPGRQKVDVDFHEPLVGSPRRLQLKDAGERIIENGKRLPRAVFLAFTLAPRTPHRRVDRAAPHAPQSVRVLL
jgi:hypothetical protein